MQPPVLKPKRKQGWPKVVVVLLIVGAALFVVAGGIAVYSALKITDEMDQTIRDLGGSAPS
jgi:hypothetical protein